MNEMKEQKLTNQQNVEGDNISGENVEVNKRLNIRSRRAIGKVPISIYFISGLSFLLSLAAISSSFISDSVVITNESVVLSFVGILATIVVIGNYSQVKSIENGFERKSNEVAIEFDKKINEIENRLNSIDKRIFNTEDSIYTQFSDNVKKLSKNTSEMIEELKFASDSNQDSIRFKFPLGGAIGFSLKSINKNYDNKEDFFNETKSSNRSIIENKIINNDVFDRMLEIVWLECKSRFG